MANYLPIACVLNRIKCVSKKHNNEESGNKKIDKKEIAIAAITIVPSTVAAVALFIVFKTGIMDLNKAFELFGLIIFGWPFLMIYLTGAICFYASDSDAAPLIMLVIMDVVLAVIIFATGKVPLFPLLIAVTAYFALQLILAELAVGSVSWLIKKIKRDGFKATGNS